MGHLRYEMTVTLAGNDSYELCPTTDHHCRVNYDRNPKLATARLQAAVINRGFLHDPSKRYSPPQDK
jgi:hypothetical protein